MEQGLRTLWHGPLWVEILWALVMKAISKQMNFGKTGGRKWERTERKHGSGKSTVWPVQQQTLSRDCKTVMSILTLLPDLHSIFSSQMFHFAFPTPVSSLPRNRAPTSVLSRTSSSTAISFKGVSRKLYHPPVAVSSSPAVPYRQFLSIIFNSGICASPSTYQPLY